MVHLQQVFHLRPPELLTECHHPTGMQFEGRIVPHTGIWQIPEACADRTGCGGPQPEGSLHSGAMQVSPKGT